MVETKLVRQLDILFVIDDSGSMKQEQETLQRNFPKFVETLKAIPGGMPDLHIGVVSTNVGAGNVIINGSPACSFPGGDRGQFKPPVDSGLEDGHKFIIVENNGTKDNIIGNGTLEGTFSKIAALGINGCGYEHPLQAARLALHESVTPSNAGFLRRDATLAIIFLTDEDDCSAPPQTDFFVDEKYPLLEQQPSLRCALVGHRCNGAFVTDFPFSTPLSNCVADENGGGKLIPVADLVRDISRLKPFQPDKIKVSAIMGWPEDPSTTNYAISRDTSKVPPLWDLEPACSSANGLAVPVLRMQQFVKAFGGHIESICQDDYGPALGKIVDNIPIKLTTGCIPGLILDSDRDANNGRFVPDCRAEERILTNAIGSPETRPIGAICNNQADPAASTNKPCFTVSRDKLCTGTNGSDGWRAQIIRDGAPSSNSVDVVSCRTCAPASPEATAGLCR